MLLKNGKTLLIRKAEKDDASNLLTYLNLVGGESDHLLFGANEFTMTIEQEEKFIVSVNTSKTSTLLIGLMEGRLVCIGSISAPQRERISHQGELALSVLKEFWGIGIGSSLVQELIGFAKCTAKLEVLHLGVKSDNARALALYEKLGFQKIGVYPRFFKINGEYYDEILMNLYL